MLLLLLFLIAGASLRTGSPVADDLALTHVAVVDVESGRLLPEQTVVIAGNRIQAVGPSASTRIPAGAQVVESRGKYLIPGLWDMHAHPWQEADLALFVANGVTGARVMFGNPRHLGWREEIRRGERLGPNLYVAGPIIEGPPPPELASVIPTEGKVLVRTGEEAAAAVKAQKAAGYDFVKVYNNLSRSAYEGLVAEARAQHLPVAGHVPFEPGLAGVLRAGQASIEHLRGYVERLVPPDAPQRAGADLRSRTLAWRYADPAKMRALAEATRDGRVWNTPTLAVRIFVLPEAEVKKYLARPGADYLAPSIALRDRRKIGWLSNFTDEDFRLAGEGHAMEDALIRALRDAGAGLLAGTDVAPWGFSLHRELELLVNAGLTPSQALAAATCNPARFLGASESLGRVRPAARADLVVLDANPLEDIRHTQKINAVVLNGRYLSRQALDRLLAQARPATRMNDAH
jgi:imidazolonepropionase-like amidohydrolase